MTEIEVVYVYINTQIKLIKDDSIDQVEDSLTLHKDINWLVDQVRMLKAKVDQLESIAGVGVKLLVGDNPYERQKPDSDKLKNDT